MKEQENVFSDLESITVQISNGIVSIGIAEASWVEDFNAYYFNRIFVNPKYRGKGYGTKLINLILNVIDEKKSKLLLDINPYGDMSYDDLEAFYVRHGFKDIGNHYLYVPKK